MTLSASLLLTASGLLGCGDRTAGAEAQPPSPSSPEAPLEDSQPPASPQDSSPAGDSELTPPADTQSPGEDSEPGADQLGDAEASDGSRIFVEGVIHQLEIEVPADSWAALLADPRSYATASLSWEGRSYEIAIRAKGNTQFRAINDKPSLVLDFNRVVENQTLDGLPSVYLHNMTYDPSMMHEHLAYGYFRFLGVPASRTAYAQLTMNGEPYGLFLFVEKQNRVYRERWWEDASGSLFETGSFNHGCDLYDVSGEVVCDCFEIDHIGSEEDPMSDLADLCLTSTSAAEETWYAAIQEEVNMSTFLLGQASEMLISHYDNYGWNRNNWRIYHEPSEQRWYFTPWSTDLSFGWNPWVANPHCGYYGQYLTEYQTGSLLGKCWGNASCLEDLKQAIEEAADGLEAYDLPGRVEETHALIQEAVYADGRRWYDDTSYHNEVECNMQWGLTRADSVRTQLSSL